MPYDKPKKQGKGYVLPKKSGGVHKSKSGKVVQFKSVQRAKRAADYIMAIEHGFNPTFKRRRRI